jgi:hypothetical protein
MSDYPSDQLPEKNPRAEAGRKGGFARAARIAAERLEAEAADQRRAELSAYLETADLTSPEAIRSYLEVCLRAVATGQLHPQAGSACGSIANKLIAAHAISITQELKELRALREKWESSQQNTGVIRHKRR